MKSFSFTVSHTLKNSKARAGVMRTPHGKVETPCFVPVGTKASIKTLTNHEIEELGYRLFFVNTYHMLVHPGIEIVKKFGGLHRFLNWSYPLITDSGGFQVFSLGAIIIKKDNNGVIFRDHYRGDLIELSPAFSIKTQRALGADIILPLDDCTEHPATLSHARSSLTLTQKWFIKSFETYQKTTSITGKHQALYRIIQGSVYPDLRRASIEFFRSNNIETDGWAIGGVSVGESKKDMHTMINVCTDYIVHEQKPIHILGVGEIDDVFEIVNAGGDTFDCVQPTRLARMGRAYNLSTPSYQIDIAHARHKSDTAPLDARCNCYACTNHTRAYIHHLFKMRELTAYRLLTLHNLSVMKYLVDNMRTAIINKSWEKVYNTYHNGEFIDLHKLFS